MLNRYFLSVGAFLGATGVILGAFAAHGLKGTLSPYLLDVFKTGVFYQLVHSLALILTCTLGFINAGQPAAQKYFHRSCFCFTIGILFFSGSLYLLAMTGVKWFGPVTPVGGLFFIIGWVMMLIAAFKMKEVTL